jgi:hypothetical protein
MEMSLTSLKKYCLKTYGVSIQDPFIKKMTTFRRTADGWLMCKVEPIFEWCEKYKECINVGCIKLCELQNKIKEECGLSVDSRDIYEQKPQFVKLSRQLVFIKDWKRIIEYYKIPKGQRRSETLIKMGTSQSEISKKGQANRRGNRVTVNLIAKSLDKEYDTIKRAIDYLKLTPIKIEQGGVSWYEKSTLDKIKKFFDENPNSARLFYKDTVMTKYGVENVSQSEEIKEKKRNTSIKNFGVDNHTKLESSRKRFSELNKKNAKLRLNKARKTKEDTIIKFEQENDCISLVHLNERDNLGYDKCGRFSDIIHKIGLDYIEYKDNIFIKNEDIPKIYEYRKLCHEHLTSYFENDVMNFVKSIYDGEVSNNIRKIIYPKELDIYVPQKKVAIECDGLYWHSDKIKPNDYHINKTIACEEKGIILLHIFEDEWDNKKEICKSIIADSLGIYQNRIDSEKCFVSEINEDLAKEFLENNSIYGFEIADEYFGLFYDNKLIYVVSVKDKQFIIQECVKLNTFVENGLNKLIDFIITQNNNLIFINIDRRLQNVEFYKSCGFEKISESEPNYYYIFGHNREKEISKLAENYRFSEEETRRIYDCGIIKMKFNK